MNPRTHALAQGLHADEQSRIAAAHAFGARHLSDIKRRGGESYAEHCLEVAMTLKESDPSASLLCIALLHDLPVHPDGKELLGEAPLTENEVALVMNMYQLRRLHINENTEDLDTVIEAFLEQPELLPLRMAHRVNDVRNMHRFTKKLQRDIAQESLHMYAAIAGRLGMQRWRSELEDGCFPIVQPKIAKQLQKQFIATDTADETCLQHTKHFLEEVFAKKNVEAEVKTRIKGLYSTYRKMVIKERAFEDLTDRLALRIVTKTPEECYRVLGIIHGVMNPIPGKLKDYIGAPKENGYRSIHTVVYPLPGVTDQPMELQIRTELMHKDCQYGQASHSGYKESMYALGRKVSRANLFRNLQNLREEVSTPQQFEESLRKYFREDHIAVFDQNNNVHHIRIPATAMDFVCQAFPHKCGRLKEVRLNGRKQDIGTPLQDGDTVEVCFGRHVKIDSAWVHACYHSSSKECLESLAKVRSD